MHAQHADRVQRAEQVWVRRLRPDIFAVLSQSKPGKEYLVGMAGPNCTCPDYQYRRHRCKHILAVERVQTQTGSIHEEGES